MKVGDYVKATIHIDNNLKKTIYGIIIKGPYEDIIELAKWKDKNVTMVGIVCDIYSSNKIYEEIPIKYIKKI